MGRACQTPARALYSWLQSWEHDPQERRGENPDDCKGFWDPHGMVIFTPCCISEMWPNQKTREPFLLCFLQSRMQLAYPSWNLERRMQGWSKTPSRFPIPVPLAAALFPCYFFLLLQGSFLMIHLILAEVMTDSRCREPGGSSGQAVPATDSAEPRAE